MSCPSPTCPTPGRRGDGAGRQASGLPQAMSEQVPGCWGAGICGETQSLPLYKLEMVQSPREGMHCHHTGHRLLSLTTVTDTPNLAPTPPPAVSLVQTRRCWEHSNPHQLLSPRAHTLCLPSWRLFHAEGESPGLGHWREHCWQILQTTRAFVPGKPRRFCGETAMATGKSSPGAAVKLTSRNKWLPYIQR